MGFVELSAASFIVGGLLKHRLGASDLGASGPQIREVASNSRLVKLRVNLGQHLVLGDLGVKVHEQFGDRTADGRSDAHAFDRLDLAGRIDRLNNLALFNLLGPPLRFIPLLEVAHHRSIRCVADPSEDTQNDQKLK